MCGCDLDYFKCDFWDIIEVGEEIEWIVYV